MQTAGVGGRVRFARSGREAFAGGDVPLLVVGENTGVLMPSGWPDGHLPQLHGEPA
jgi:hypothetical protein